MTLKLIAKHCLKRKTQQPVAMAAEGRPERTESFTPSTVMNITHALSMNMRPTKMSNFDVFHVYSIENNKNKSTDKYQ